MHFFYVYGFVVRFRLDSVLRCMFITILFSLTIQNCHERMVNTVTLCCASEFSSHQVNRRDGPCFVGMAVSFGQAGFPIIVLSMMDVIYPKKIRWHQVHHCKMGTVEDGRVLEYGNAEFTYMTVPRCYSEI